MDSRGDRIFLEDAKWYKNLIKLQEKNKRKKDKILSCKYPRRKNPNLENLQKK